MVVTIPRRCHFRKLLLKFIYNHMSFYVNFVLCLCYVIVLRGHIKGTASATYSILYATRAQYGI